MLADAYIHELGENEHAGRDPGCRQADPARYERENSTPPAATFEQRPCLSYQVVSAQRLRLNRPFDKAPERADVSGVTDTLRLDPFAEFVREYQDMVYATAVRLLSNPAEAEDVAQTVFLKAFERFDEIGSSPAVAGWLKTVATNLCLNYLSRYRSRWRLFSELQADDADESPRDQVDLLLARSTGPSPLAGPPARANRPLSLRGQELRGDRRDARREPRESEDRHPSRPRGP